MKHEIMLRGLPDEARLAPLVRRLAGHVEKQAGPCWQRTGVLRAVVRKYPTRACYRVSLVLSVPRHTLVADDEGPEAEQALRAAFLEVERQLRKQKSRLRREDLWKRRQRRARMRREWKLEAVPREERERALLADLIHANLERLYTGARREIAHHVAAGDLARDDLGLADVVDAVVLRACAEFRRRPANLEVGAWLNRLTIEQLDADGERLGRDRTETVRVEDAVPAAPPGGEEGLGLEDVVPDRAAPGPDRVAECHDLERCLRDAVAGLPPALRIAFELHYVEELPIADVARMTRRTETQVRGALDSARLLLRQRIAASGLALSG